jgi:hypothetical protein
MVLAIMAHADYAQESARLTPLMDRFKLLARMEENIDAMHAATLDRSGAMDAQLLGGHGGPGFSKALERTFAPDVLRSESRTALAAALSGHEAALEIYLAFLETKRGSPHHGIDAGSWSCGRRGAAARPFAIAGRAEGR